MVIFASQLLLATINYGILSASNRPVKSMFKPYGPKMCRELCKQSHYSFTFMIENLSCNWIPRYNSRSKKKGFNEESSKHVKKSMINTRNSITAKRDIFEADHKVSPRTCSEVLEKDPDATDGKYLLYPSAQQFHDQGVKIYCKMKSKYPKEYITLFKKNCWEYPQKIQTWYWKCLISKVKTGKMKVAGKSCFTKIRVDPKNMSVRPADVTFFKSRTKLPVEYGRSGGCDAKDCKPKGIFIINTLGTGMKFSNQLAWKGTGRKPRPTQVKRYRHGARIRLNCDGECGSCVPDGELILYPNPQDKTK